MNTTGLKSLKILGISITTNSKEEILEYIRKYLNQSQKSKVKSQNRSVKPLLIVTPNPEQIVYALSNPHFTEILNQADVAIPDGIGISLSAKFLRDKRQATSDKIIIHRIPGIEFMEDLVRIAAERGYTIGLIGGRGGVAVKALECLQMKYPDLQGWGEDGPEIKVKSQKVKVKTESQNSKNIFLQQYNNIAIEQSGKDITDEYIRQVAERIKRTRTQLVFVGLGAPKQEYFIEKLVRYSLLVHRKIDTIHSDQRTNKLTNHSLVLMAVGGSFDIIAGKTPRAPLVLQTIGVEWLWRLFKEPWRWRRQRALVKFFWLVLKSTLKG